MNKLLFSIVLIVSFLTAQPLTSYNFVDSLDTEQLAFLDSVTALISIDDGCNGSIYESREQFNCPDARSFYNFAAWNVKNEKPADFVLDKVRGRNGTFYAPERFDVAPSYITVAGDSSSPIEIMAYVTSTCPYCKKVGNPLREIVEGPYRGKASFVIKPIHHKLGDYALLAAEEQGKAWELFEAYGIVAHRLDEEAIIAAAVDAGIDTVQLKSDIDLKNDEYVAIITANHEEAKANGMKFTPTLYFNGYRYRSNKHPIWLMDYIDYLTRTGDFQ